MKSRHKTRLAYLMIVFMVVPDTPIAFTRELPGPFSEPMGAPRNTTTYSFREERTDTKEEPHSVLLPSGIMILPSTKFTGWLPPPPRPSNIDPIRSPENYRASAVVSYNHGIFLFNEGRPGQAREEWMVALHLQPIFAEAHYALGYLNTLQGNMKEAREHVTKAWKLKPDWAAAIYQMGLLAYQGDQHAEAGRHFLEASHREPDNPLPWNSLGLSRLREGNVPGAEQALHKAIEIDPTRPYSHLNLGLIFMARQEWEKARQEFSLTRKLDPTTALPHVWMGFTHAARGHWAQAISSWQQVLTITPSQSPTHRLLYNLGIAYWMSGNHVEARQAFQAALSHHPTLPQLHFQLGVIEMVDSRWKRASDYFVRASELAPLWNQPFFNLGRVRYHQGLMEEAREAFQQAISLEPQEPDSHYYLGLIHHLMHHDNLAYQEMRIAAQAGHTAAQDMLANMLAHGHGVEESLPQAMQWWFRASQGQLDGPSAKHAQEQLSQLRQMYFLNPENQVFQKELLKGFQKIREELGKDSRSPGPDIPPSLFQTSTSRVLMAWGDRHLAIPLLIHEALALDSRAHESLENLLRNQSLEGSPELKAQVIQYFTKTASEGSQASCQFLNSLNHPSGILVTDTGVIRPQTPLCGESHP